MENCVAISLRQIRYFVATAEQGQITQAASALSISQSAITTSIKELEETVGAELFSRSPQGMELTPIGRQFLFHAYDILNKVEEATSLRVPAGDVEGSLTLAATYTVIGYFLPNHLERLKRNYPRLNIQLFELTREAIEEGLLSNRYDIAVLLTSNVQNPDLTMETLIGSRRRLWVPSKHRLLQQEAVSLKDVAAEPYIMLTVDEAAHTSLKYWSKTAFQPHVVLRTSSVEAVRSMVANGQGVAILSDMVLRPWSLEGRRIETIVLSDPVPAMDIGLAWRRNIEFTPAMEVFRSYFRQAFYIPTLR
ncbi:putative transcriptional regulatory protein, LysR-family [Bradyrhizobium oligotrophicum S58]|uniref:Putative transcriptional regulatory protein, LysR-family n=1 Tax=Bradyrhizobium oligotrophicum S58 TaxID=1245469 RepID=M4ZC86_9BRAD|nr:putative transcriptional regulatory protein, LysR-family [Bradyrhizobium oligotrophicum S58]